MARRLRPGRNRRGDHRERAEHVHAQQLPRPRNAPDDPPQFHHTQQAILQGLKEALENDTPALI
jgi:hypothetical protein